MLIYGVYRKDSYTKDMYRLKVQVQYIDLVSIGID